MVAGVAQIVLFMSSYAPLFVVFGLLETFGSGAPSYACFVLAAAATLGLVVFVRFARRMSPSEIAIGRAEQRDGDTIAYVVTYLLPFLGLSAGTGRGRLAIVIFLLVIGALYLRSHLFYVNPLLALAGYRLFRVETPSQRVLLLISRRKYLAAGRTVQAVTLSDYVFMEARNQDG